MDACDRLGLLVFTEMPGWQHIGGQAWQDQAVENIKDMIVQYRNHPSIILWGVRINESQDNDAFYERTNATAHALDDTRQTGGVRAMKKSHLLEDVYTYNDFVHSGANAGCEPKEKVTSDVEKPYLITEYNGHMYPTKMFDWEEHRREHMIRHANVLDTVAGQEDIAVPLAGACLTTTPTRTLAAETAFVITAFWICSEIQNRQLLFMQAKKTGIRSWNCHRLWISASIRLVTGAIPI